VAAVPRLPVRRPSAGTLAVPVVGNGVIIAGLCGAAPVSVALVLVGAAVTAYGAMMARRVPPTRGEGALTGAGARRQWWAVGLLAAGVLLSGAATIAAGAATGLAPGAYLGDVPLPAELPLVGLFLTAGTYLLGLVLMPGAAATLVGRLRRTLDGLALGVCLFFVAWLLLFAARGLRGASLTAVLLATVAASAATVGALRAAQGYRMAREYRPSAGYLAMSGHRAALACGAGVVVSIGGLTGLVVALDYFAGRGWVLGASALLLAGSALTWHGLAASDGASALPDPPVDPPVGDGSFAGYPLLALPLAGALVTAAYHFVLSRGFDTVSIVLGIAGVALLAVREALAVADVRRYARRLAVREEHFRSLVVGSTDVAMMLDARLVVLWQSPAAARQFGLSDQDVVGRSLLRRVHPDDAAAVAERLAAVQAEGTDGRAAFTADRVDLIEARFRDGFGAWRDTEWTVSDQRSAAAVGALVVHVRDVSERRELQRTLHRGAYVDQLTGLPNRRELRRALQTRTAVAVLVVCGVDGVRAIKQARGLEVGDAVLVEAARRLRGAVAATDLPVRLDGEEFAVLTEGGAIQAQLLATRLLTVLTEPYALSGVTLSGATARVTASAGLAEHFPDADADTVLGRAGQALQRARRQGPTGSVEWYDEATEAELLRRLTIEQDLAGAAARGEINLRYQPIVALAERRPVGVEALPRWRHPTLGVIDAAELLPVAAECGLLDEIGSWATDRAIGQLSGWLRSGWDVTLSINVSVGQLADAGYGAALFDALAGHKVPPARVVLEFAEAGLVALGAGYPAGGSDGRGLHSGGRRTDDLATSLTELRSRGVRVALGRVGRHDTPLSQLRVLPLDLLKLDRYLLHDAGPRVVEAVVGFARQLGVDVAVDGLTSEAELFAALSAGCLLGQGDLFSQPLPPEHLEAYLDQHRTSPFRP
jgi:diguanylate cyclase (GGDEF)-like protein/PAS domain S-box-containing protein